MTSPEQRTDEEHRACIAGSCAVLYAKRIDGKRVPARWLRPRNRRQVLEYSQRRVKRERVHTPLHLDLGGNDQTRQSFQRIQKPPDLAERTFRAKPQRPFGLKPLALLRQRLDRADAQPALSSE